MKLDLNPWTESKVACCTPNCNFEVVSSYNCLFDHCRNVHEWEEIACSFENCNFVAYNARALRSHKSHFHSKHRSFAPKKFPCHWKRCKSSFKSNAALETHMKIHKNELFECVFCPFRTGQSGELTSHCRLHFKMFDFKCNYCDKIFVTKKRLNDHFSVTHSDENHTCHICKKYSGTKQKLQQHIRENHKFLTKWNESKKTFETFSRS